MKTHCARKWFSRMPAYLSPIAGTHVIAARFETCLLTTSCSWGKYTVALGLLCKKSFINATDNCWALVILPDPEKHRSQLHTVARQCGIVQVLKSKERPLVSSIFFMCLPDKASHTPFVCCWSMFIMPDFWCYQFNSNRVACSTAYHAIGLTTMYVAAPLFADWCCVSLCIDAIDCICRMENLCSLSGPASWVLQLVLAHASSSKGNSAQAGGQAVSTLALLRGFTGRSSTTVIFCY